MKVKCIINLFGGPGCGKSTLASGLFYHWKTKGLSVELISEYAKECVFENRNKILQEDQLYIFTKQHRKIFRTKDIYDFLIVDSPLPLSMYYINNDSFYNKEIFNSLVLSTFNKYPNLNFFLSLNKDYDFENEGRLHNIQESEIMENEIRNMLTQNNIEFYDYINNDNMIEIIGTKLDIFLRKTQND